MSEENVPERRRINDFYRNVDANLKLWGALQMGQRNIWVRLSRYAAHSNLIEPELRAILIRINDLGSWYPAWAERAKRFEVLGNEAASRKHLASAAEYLLTASLLYHFAQINTRPENPLKAEGAQRSAACYEKAAPLFTPVAKRICLPFENVELPGYLRCPPGITRPPVVVLINGANSSKEELHPWTEVFLRRGLATMIFDGPGQGEMAPGHGRSRFRSDDYDRALRAVLDWVEAEGYLNGNRMALWGMSLGGLLAAQAAVQDRRVRAVVSVGGLYSLGNYANLAVPTQEEMRDLTGFQTLRETEAYFASAYTTAHLGPITCPFLVVHGALDEIVSTEEARRLAARAGVHAELVVFDDGVHCCYNLYQELRPRIADWVVDKLNVAPI
jgi:2,6-dihydroxypseudooxynicotine hydrolase